MVSVEAGGTTAGGAVLAPAARSWTILQLGQSGYASLVSCPEKEGRSVAQNSMTIKSSDRRLVMGTLPFIVWPGNSPAGRSEVSGPEQLVTKIREIKQYTYTFITIMG